MKPTRFPLGLALFLGWGGGHMQGVGAGSGIYKTADAGKSWTRLTNPALYSGLPADVKLGRIGLAIYPKNPRVVYAVIQNNQGVKSTAITPFGGVFRSDDAGRSWALVSQQPCGSQASVEAKPESRRTRAPLADSRH